MANEKKTTKVQVCVLMELEDFVKAKRIYGKDGESNSIVIQNIIHDLVKDVKLTPDELEYINKETKKQYEKRMNCRAKKRAVNTTAKKKTL